MNPEEITVSAAALGVLKELTTKPLSELGEILADRTRFWRLKNQIKILEEAKAYAESKGISINPIALKTLLPLLEGCSLEEEPSIQELWAKLLIGSGHQAQSQHVQNIAIDLLKSVSTDDAVLIEAMVAQIFARYEDSKGQVDIFSSAFDVNPKTLPPRFEPYRYLNMKDIRLKLAWENDRFMMSVDNAVRHGVIGQVESYDGDGRPDGRTYHFTRLGWKIISLIMDIEEPVEKKRKNAP